MPGSKAHQCIGGVLSVNRIPGDRIVHIPIRVIESWRRELWRVPWDYPRYAGDWPRDHSWATRLARATSLEQGGLRAAVLRRRSFGFELWTNQRRMGGFAFPIRQYL